MAGMAKAPAPKKEKAPPPLDEVVEDKKDGEKKTGICPPNKLKLILLLFAGLAVGIGGTFAVMTFLGGPKPAPAPAGPASSSAGEEQAAPPVAPQRAGGSYEAPETGGGPGGEAAPAGQAGPFNIEFKPFIVNLSDLGGRRMLKLTMSVEADAQELADEINSKMPQFRDTILLLLSSIQSEDVSGLDGKQRLKNQMINRLNPNLTRGKIRNLYFSEIVVQ